MTLRGFTLLELLVAMAIFSVMSVMAYSGLRSMIDTKEHVEQEADKLAELQLSLTVLGRDIQQAVARTVRNEDGDVMASMIWEEDTGVHFSLTRGGWNNPAGRLRSDLQRVQYQLANGELSRKGWSVLDRAPDSRPNTRTVLSGVEQFSAEFLDDMDQWHKYWPVNPMGTEMSEQILKKLPEAIRVSLDIKGWGRIQRLYLVAR